MHAAKGKEKKGQEMGEKRRGREGRKAGAMGRERQGRKEGREEIKQPLSHQRGKARGGTP